MNANFPPLAGMPPFVMPPALGTPEAKLFEQLTQAHLNNNNLPSPLNATFAPLTVPPSSTVTTSAGNSSSNSTNSNGSTNANDNPERNTPEYLQQLLKDKRHVQELLPTIQFQHVDRILDDEIFRVRLQLFHISLTNLVEPMEIPEVNSSSPVVTITEKVYIPTKEHPEFNFVGRLLGPRGTTAKFLEHVLEAKIMVRGKGSMREKRLEDTYRGKPHWEHLKDELHVLLTVETGQNRAEQVLKRACQAIKKFLEVIPDGDDPWKKLQLMELATYNNDRFTIPGMPGMPGMPPGAKLLPAALSQLGLPGMGGHNANNLAGMPLQAPRIFPNQLTTMPQLRSPNPAGAPILLGHPRLGVPTSGAPSSMPSGTLLNAPPMMTSPNETPPMFPMTYDYSAYATALSPIAFEYAGLSGDSVAGRGFFHPCISPPLHSPLRNHVIE